MKWHREAVTAPLLEVLEKLQRSGVLEGFYLAGGTGLALHLGHRPSADLDFFTRDPLREEVLLQRAQSVDRFEVASRDEGTLHVHVGGTEVSFLRYDYPLLRPTSSFEGVQVADPVDIACMKTSAVAGRGTRRDFIDLYVVARELGLAALLEQFRKKFAPIEHSEVHILKSLTYFVDAEKEPMPQVLIDLEWEAVKRFFLDQAPPLLDSE